MSSVDTIENLSTAFHQMSRMAFQAMNKSIEEEKYGPACEARILFVAQAVSSVVAIPFLLISSFFIMLWKLGHGEVREAAYAIPAALILSGYHACTIFASALAAIAPMSWTSKSMDCFQVEQKKITPSNVEA